MANSDQQVVLVTGAAGFIGSSLIDRLLSEGRTVVGVDNFCDFYPREQKERHIEPAFQNGLHLIEEDIRDRDAIMQTFEQYQPAEVIHLAAMAGVRPSIEDPALYTAVNLDGTVNVLDAAVKHGTGKVLFASSSSVYGNNEKVPFAEVDPVDHPISPYAATKKAGELLCHTYAHLYDLPIFCLRFFTVFGPRQRPDLAISKFLKLVADDQTIPMFGDGSSSRDYTYIDDIVDGVLKALARCGDSNLPGYRVYNLGGSDPVSLKEMIDTIGRVVGKQPKIDQKPMQPGDVDRTYADISRAADELGYEVTTRLDEGIARQWAWLQQEML